MLVSTYFDEIYQFVLKKENPANICMQIGACSPTRVVKRAAEQSPCAICELVVQMAETYLENNATEQQLQQKLDSICADLPAPYGGEVRLDEMNCSLFCLPVIVRAHCERLPPSDR